MGTTKSKGYQYGHIDVLPQQTLARLAVYTPSGQARYVEDLTTVELVTIIREASEVLQVIQMRKRASGVREL